MTTVGNIGLGLLILIIVWILTCALFVYSVRVQSNIGWISLAVTTLITIILVIIPTEPKKEKVATTLELEKDYSSLYRGLFLTFLSISSLLALIYLFIFHCIDPIRPKLLKSF